MDRRLILKTLGKGQLRETLPLQDSAREGIAQPGPVEEAGVTGRTPGLV